MCNCFLIVFDRVFLFELWVFKFRSILFCFLEINISFITRNNILVVFIIYIGEKPKNATHSGTSMSAQGHAQE